MSCENSFMLSLLFLLAKAVDEGTFTSSLISWSSNPVTIRAAKMVSSLEILCSDKKSKHFVYFTSMYFSKMDFYSSVSEASPL